MLSKHGWRHPVIDRLFGASLFAVAGRASTARPAHPRTRLQADEPARLLQRHGERSLLLPEPSVGMEQLSHGSGLPALLRLTLVLFLLLRKS